MALYFISSAIWKSTAEMQITILLETTRSYMEIGHARGTLWL
jgi:hypothetical protein